MGHLARKSRRGLQDVAPTKAYLGEKKRIAGGKHAWEKKVKTERRPAMEIDKG